MNLEMLQVMNRARHAQTPIVRAIPLNGGPQRLIMDFNDADPLAAAAKQAVASDKSQTITLADGDWFLHVLNPPIHLIVVGAVHIAQALARLAQDLDWRVTIIDPRTAFASAERFPGHTVLTGWPDEELAKLPLGPRTALVALTHDPKLDDPAFRVSLSSPCFYLGALGSRKTHTARLERLRVSGFTPDQLARIHGPVGLDIGAQSPTEIAIAILGQIIACAHGRTAPL